MSRAARIAAGVVQEIVAAAEGFTLAECFSASFVSACVPCGDDVGAGWTATQAADGGWAFAAPEPTAPPALVASVTALGFLDLFTESEQARVFATVCPQAPELFGFLAKLFAAGTVQLTDPRVVAGVSLLGMGGLVAPSRPAQVLGNTTPVTADRVAFDVSRATESSPTRADAVRFDTARAVESGRASADRVTFDTSRATEGDSPD